MDFREQKVVSNHIQALASGRNSKLREDVCKAKEGFWDPRLVHHVTGLTAREESQKA